MDGPFLLGSVEPIQHWCGGCSRRGRAEPLQDVTAFHTAGPFDEVLDELVVVGLPIGERVRGCDEPIDAGQHVDGFSLDHIAASDCRARV